jgi:type IX secretion system PorP/SprF family membrane protein
MKHFITLFLLVAVLICSKAQNVTPAQEFIINSYQVSPSNSGFSGNHEVFVGGLYHIIGISGSPINVGANYNGIIKGNSGIGAKLNFEKFGAFQNVNADVSYAYHLKLANAHRLSLGLAFQLNQTSINYANSNSDPLNDAQLASNELKSGIGFNAAFGVTYNWKQFMFSAAINNLIPTKKNKLSLTSTPQHLRFYLHYNININRKFTIKPVVLVDYTFNSAINYHGIVSLKYANRIWLNVGYGANNLLSVGLGALLIERLSLQYTFQHALGGIIKTSAGNHQLCLGIAFGKLKSNSSSVFKKLSKSPYHDWE